MGNLVSLQHQKTVLGIWIQLQFFHTSCHTSDCDVKSS